VTAANLDNPCRVRRRQLRGLSSARNNALAEASALPESLEETLQTLESRAAATQKSAEAVARAAKNSLPRPGPGMSRR
jgi:hypothetical protein